MQEETLQNRYQIVRKIGEGAFGVTYIAQDLEMPSKPLRVVKELKPHESSPKVFEIALKLFEREALSLEKLGEHSQIPRLYAHFASNGKFYLVQEFIDGHDLTEEIDEEKPLTEKQTIELLKEILQGLQVVHEAKIIHRDLKPENIMRRKSDRQIVLIDFGAVKDVSNVTITSGKTPASTVAIGTPGYMPFEQAFRQPTLASDVYAVGMIGIFALTGCHPNYLERCNETGKVQWRQLVPDVSDSLAEIIDKMVEEDPHQRYQNAGKVLEAFKEIRTEKENPFIPTINVNPKPLPPSPPNNITRNRFLKLSLFAGVGVVAAIAIPQVLLKRQQDPLIVKPPSNETPTANTLKSFSFKTPTVDSNGKIIKTEDKTAEYLSFDLGGGVTIDLVAIPGGSFVMGSDGAENPKNDYERPPRKVTLKPFFMAKYPVTQGQYQQIMGNNPSGFKGSNRPVEQVSWNDAVSFCAKLSKKLGKTFNLPSEAQWEYACSAGTRTAFAFGPVITSKLVNFNSGPSTPNEVYVKETTTVGAYPPNAFGLYDMHGNVWEWCLDNWWKNYEGAPADGSARVDVNQNKKVLRGGSWGSAMIDCRSAKRRWNFPEKTKNYDGFRIVYLP